MSKKRMADTEVKKEMFLKTMEQTFGNVTKAAKLCNIDRQMVYSWTRTDADFSEKFYSNDFAESFKDMVEDKLARLALQENPTVLIFLAKTKCKDRGYIEKIETENINKNINTTLNIEFIGGETQTES